MSWRIENLLRTHSKKINRVSVNNQLGDLMLVEIKVDGSVWMELNVKDQVAPEVIKILENAYQQILATQSNSVMLKAVHQLRKKYG